VDTFLEFRDDDDPNYCALAADFAVERRPGVFAAPSRTVSPRSERKYDPPAGLVAEFDRAVADADAQR
jgi:hypothetical protein